MLFMVFTFIIAVACAKLAQVKNRNAIGWFILGVLFGIFGLGVLVLLPELERRWTR